MPINPDRITGADTHLATALVLAIVNDGREMDRILHNRRNAVKRLGKGGGYDPILAGRMWRYLVEGYLPNYRKSDGDVGRVDIPTRNLAGRLLELDQREYIYADAGLDEPTFPADVELRGEPMGNAPTLAHDVSDLAPAMGGK